MKLLYGVQACPAEAPVGPELVRAGEDVAAERALDKLVAVPVQVVPVGELADARIGIKAVAREVAPEN